MHALKPSYLPPQPPKRSRTVPRTKAKSRQHPHRPLAIEATVRLSVNVVLSTVAISALTQLLPYRSSQIDRLQELQAALKSMDERVQQVKSNFEQYFDPYRTEANMQAQSHRIGAQQRRIVWREPANRR
ncbi:hypothetical protein [Stenomitos frigidus]|uniref:Uncharacterized protein n=1 Tax=Stenomitos frigidus ULC18 TaxID=2107698 RepID=A0A2T1E6R3_9CYAN|nr:hypothetical protein [Stenomitos frigidus]PSB28429.1 hypothetical protein C7B82_13190 [Stenomitos frigidus ULC18]